MGEPTTPTPAERAATLDEARALVAAVTNDEPYLLGDLRPLPSDLAKAIETRIFRLSQDLAAVYDAPVVNTVCVLRRPVPAIILLRADEGDRQTFTPDEARSVAAMLLRAAEAVEAGR